MKAYALTIPAALLAAGCAELGESVPPAFAPVPADPSRSTPSAHVDDWQETPAPLAMMAPSANEALFRWMLPPANPWAAYQKTTLLTALYATESVAELPPVEHLDVVQRAWRSAGAAAAAGLASDTMWVVDLRGAASVAFASALSSASPDAVAPVMTFHNWPAENEVVPAEETLAAMVRLPPDRAPPAEAGHPVFMLDAWRLAHRSEPPDPEAVDNRYMLTPSDLPSAEVLIERGIRHVLYVVEDLETTDAEEDDLHEAFVAYQDAGIHLSIVDLALLDRFEAGPLWEGQYERPLHIDRERPVVVNDPRFFSRARGGFGGPQVIYGAGVGHHGGG